MKNLPLPECGVAKVMYLLGGKWKLLILWRISQQKTIRFNELKRTTNGITNMMLTRSLNELIEIGFVVRNDHQTIPPHVEYTLTDLGKTFIPMLKAINTWGTNHLIQKH
ncbi:MAG TPA: helix-turn-helix domain-containing protein [Arachidicoccus sp.]